MALFTIKLARAVIALVLVFCCSNLFASTDDDSLVLRLKWFHQFQFAGYYAALEKGYYSQEGLKVVIKQRDIGKNPLDEVVTGEVDFGISDSSLILKRLNGSPVVALAVIMQSSPLVLMSLDEKQVTTPFDLIGKRIMYQENVDDAIIMGSLMSLTLSARISLSFLTILMTKR